MVYEARVTSVSELFRELQDLDADEGVRILTNRGGRRRFIFITRHSGKYAVAICEAYVKRGRLVPGKSPTFKEFLDQRRLREFVKEIVTKPLKAYVY